MSAPGRGVDRLEGRPQRARRASTRCAQGYIHEIKMTGVRPERGAPLLHDFGYYTVNQIPAWRSSP